MLPAISCITISYCYIREDSLEKQTFRNHTIHLNVHQLGCCFCQSQSVSEGGRDVPSSVIVLEKSLFSVVSLFSVLVIISFKADLEGKLENETTEARRVFSFSSLRSMANRAVVMVAVEEEVEVISFKTELETDFLREDFLG